MHVPRTTRCCSQESCGAAQVQYGNAGDALMANEAHASMLSTLNVHYLQSEAIYSRLLCSGT